ncbi:hypothetical protein D3C75_1209010 [compost metagenome]
MKEGGQWPPFSLACALDGRVRCAHQELPIEPRLKACEHESPVRMAHPTVDLGCGAQTSVRVTLMLPRVALE